LLAHFLSCALKTEKKERLQLQRTVKRYGPTFESIFEPRVSIKDHRMNFTILDVLKAAISSYFILILASRVLWSKVQGI